MQTDDILRRVLFLPERASSFAERVDGLHYFVIITTMVVSSAVGLTALAFFVRYRRRYEGQLTPKSQPPRWLEVAFVVVPGAFFLVWFGHGYSDFVWLKTPPAEAMDVYVMGKQWMWKFSYPDGPNAIDVLRVPANRPVRLLLTSRDVIHSFFVPEFRLKQDALPGRYTQTWFTPTRVGRFQVLCAEYCGVDHSVMRGEVVVMDPAEFDRWQLEQKNAASQPALASRLDGNPASNEPVPAQGSMAQQGLRVALVQGCLRCHTTDGTPHIGPTWLDLYKRREKLSDGSEVVADEAYLTESMMDPLARLVAGYGPVMPAFQGKLQAPDTAALVELIKSLRSDRVGREPSPGPTYVPTPQ
jgi:cytochrome c oxidase subunit II